MVTRLASWANGRLREPSCSSLEARRICGRGRFAPRSKRLPLSDRLSVVCPQCVSIAHKPDRQRAVADVCSSLPAGASHTTEEQSRLARHRSTLAARSSVSARGARFDAQQTSVHASPGTLSTTTQSRSVLQTWDDGLVETTGTEGMPGRALWSPSRASRTGSLQAPARPGRATSRTSGAARRLFKGVDVGCGPC